MTKLIIAFRSITKIRPKRDRRDNVQKSEGNHDVKTAIIMADMSMIMAMTTVTATKKVMIRIVEKL
jgi:hypothetical protein